MPVVDERFGFGTLGDGGILDVSFPLTPIPTDRQIFLFVVEVGVRELPSALDEVLDSDILTSPGKRASGAERN